MVDLSVLKIDSKPNKIGHSISPYHITFFDFFSFDDPGIGLRFISNPMVSAAGFQARSSEYSEKTYNGHFMFRTFWYTVLLCIYSFVTFLILACKTWFFGCYTSISILTGWYLSVGVCVYSILPRDR